MSSDNFELPPTWNYFDKAYDTKLFLSLLIAFDSKIASQLLQNTPAKSKGRKISHSFCK